MESSKYVTKVDGMICPQCEDEIAGLLIHRRGILRCDTGYRKSEVSVEYDPAIIGKEEIVSVLASAGYPVGKGSSGYRADLIAVLSVAALYFMIPFLTGLVNIPEAESGADLLSFFIIGVLTGVHCIGMCGGIMLTQKNALLYNTGRLIAYTAVGAVCGMIGTALAYDIQTRSMLLTVCGTLVLFIGLKMWGVPFLRRISPEPAKPCRFKGRAFTVGLLTGLMPCGALSPMWLIAASSGSPLTGAGSMFAFGLGTCVFMLIFGLFGVFIPKRYNRYILKISTVLIVSTALILITKGLKLLL